VSTRADWQDDLTGPTWVRRIWARRRGRIALSLGFLGVAAWILAMGLSDPDEFLDRGRNVLGFVCAPVLVVVFAITLVETVRDLVRGENRRPLFTRRSFHRPAAIFMAIYVPVALAAFVLWH
jgi:amino acid transporter